MTENILFEFGRDILIPVDEHFFNTKEIKKLRKADKGDTYTIIYLKMILLAFSNKGKIYYDEIEETVYQELALELDEDADTVFEALKNLSKLGLIEQSDEYIDVTLVSCFFEE